MSNEGVRRRKRSDPESVGSLLGAVVKDLGLHKGRQDRLSQLQPAWEEAVGRQTAEQTRLVGLKQGTLSVEVGSSALAQEIEVYYQAAILKHLKERVKVPVTRIRCSCRGRGPGAS